MLQSVLLRRWHTVSLMRRPGAQRFAVRDFVRSGKKQQIGACVAPTVHYTEAYGASTVAVLCQQGGIDVDEGSASFHFGKSDLQETRLESLTLATRARASRTEPFPAELWTTESFAKPVVRLYATAQRPSWNECPGPRSKCRASCCVFVIARADQL